MNNGEKVKTLNRVQYNIFLALILMLFSAANAMAQSTITGTVTDGDTGETLPGVNISLKGTTTGTSTDSNGHYELNVQSLQDTLLFSFVGYQSQEVPLNGRTELNITLQSQAITGQEMVVVGYGEQEKKDLTGSIKSVNMEDIPPSSTLELTQALRGTVAGLNITGGYSAAGDEPELQIGAQKSLSAGNSPLIVVDGIIFHGSINDINMSDVKRVDVLKDASAAAVYGSKSANGVVLITTKSGGQGEPTINFSSNVGIQTYTNNPVKYMNGEQYAERLVNFSYISELDDWYATKPTGPDDNGGRPAYPDISDPKVITSYLKSQEEVDNYLAGHEINWFNQVTRTAPLQNYNLDVSGGTEDISYYISGSRSNQKGILVNDAFIRNTLAASVSADITDWFTIGLKLSYSHRDYSGVSVSLGSAKRTSPLVNLYDKNGDYPLLYNTEFLMAHPLRQTLIDNKDIRKYIDVMPHFHIDIPLIKGLSDEFKYSYNENSQNNDSSIPQTVYEASTTGGQVTLSNSRETNWLFNNIVNYKRDFADHSLDVTLLFSRESRSGQSSNIYSEQFQNQVLGYNNVSFGGFTTAGSGAYEENSVAYMARLNYSFLDRYLLTGTIRKDGYSGFGAKNKYATFRSISAAWVVSSEDILKSANWLNQLKLRVSYGENGNQGVGRYASLAEMGTVGYVYGSSRTIGIFPNVLGNDNLKWEKTGSYNIGLDYGMLDDRISGSIDVYNSKTKNVLVNRALPGATGYTSVWTNIGGIKTKGIDFDLSTTNIQGPFQWNTNFVFSLNRDKITKLYGNGQDDIGNGWFIGEPISAIYDYKRPGGIWTEEDLFNGKIPGNFFPGQYKITDIDKDGEITSADRTIIGYGKPSYRFSINNSLSYKNFTLNFLITSVQGGSGYYMQDASQFLEPTAYSDYANRENQYAIHEYWTPFNGVTNAPGIYNYPPVQSGNYHSRSFVRLQNISLVYNFDKNVLNKLNLKRLQIYVDGRNLYTWSKWPGYDPELGTQEALKMRSVSGGIKIGL